MLRIFPGPTTPTLGVMRDVDTPQDLADALVDLFPSFAVELEDEDLPTFHRVFFLLVPHLRRCLESASDKAVNTFCGYINAFVDAGGVKKNAVSTCLLEHASQVGVCKVLLAQLTPAAKKGLR